MSGKWQTFCLGLNVLIVKQNILLCHSDLIHVYSSALISIRGNVPSWLYTLACPSISHLGVYDVIIELLPDHSSPLSKLHTVTKWQKLKSFGNSLVAKWTTLGATMVRLFRLWIIFGDRFGHYCCGGPCLFDCIWRPSLDTLWWALPGWLYLATIIGHLVVGPAWLILMWSYQNKQCSKFMKWKHPKLGYQVHCILFHPSIPTFNHILYMQNIYHILI